MPRSRRTVIDGGFDTGGQSWSTSDSEAGFNPGKQHISFFLGFTVDIGGQISASSVTLWSTGLLSLGPATQAQIDFVASGASPFPDAAGGNPGFPGEFIAFAYSGDSFQSYDYGIGVVDYAPEFNLSEAVPTAFFDLGGTQIILDEQGFTLIDVPGNARFGVGGFPGSIPETAGSGSGETLAREWSDTAWFTLKGSTGPDLLISSKLDEFLNGGAGEDTAVFHNLAADYRFGSDGRSSITVEDPFGSDGRDTLDRIEELQFLDRSFAVLPGGERQAGGTAGSHQSEPAILSLADGTTVLAWTSEDPISEKVFARAFAPGGQDLTAESRVNTFPGGFQYGAKAAALTEGGYVIVWNSAGQDGSGAGVYLQRYTAGGAATGPETRVNTVTSNAQENPSVAALAGGGFVVVWESFGQDGSGDGVYAQRFAANGTATGPELRVNLATTGYQLNPAVHALAGGGYVVVWESWEGYEVFARVFGADGSTSGPDIRVNTFTPGYQDDASLTALAGGGFVIAWASTEQDGDARGIFAQRFGADGTPLGAEFRVNTATPGDQTGPSVTPLAGGGFVIAWTSFGAGGADADIYLQRYDAAGSTLGSETRINTTTNGFQESPVVTALAGGGFVVAWTSRNADGSSGDLWLQRWSANGARLGVETRINTTTEGDQYALQLAPLPDGGFTAAWVSAATDGSSSAVVLQRFDASGNRVLPTVAGTPGDDRIDLGAPGDLQASGGNGNDTYVVDSSGDRIDESPDVLLGGQDTVFASVSYTLGNYLENLFLDPGAGNGIGNARANIITGNGAANTLSGNGGADSLAGGEENDNLIGGLGNDSLQGDGGNDTLTGSAGRDVLAGGAGADLYVVDALDTVLELPGAGLDTVQGAITLRAPDSVENLVLTGSGGVGATGNLLPNRLSGNVAGNLLAGAGGNDTLVGNGGADTLAGGAGKDILNGGPGDDVFLFNASLSAISNLDTVTDFVKGADLIMLDTRIFQALDAGAGFGESQFRAAPGAIRAADASDRIIYNTTTGTLFYDADGAGGVDAVKFAVLGASTHPVLGFADIVLI